MPPQQLPVQVYQDILGLSQLANCDSMTVVCIIMQRHGRFLQYTVTVRPACLMDSAGCCSNSGGSISSTGIGSNALSSGCCSTTTHAQHTVQTPAGQPTRTCSSEASLPASGVIAPAAASMCINSSSTQAEAWTAGRPRPTPSRPVFYATGRFTVKEEVLLLLVVPTTQQPSQQQQQRAFTEGGVGLRPLQAAIRHPLSQPNAAPAHKQSSALPQAPTAVPKCQAAATAAAAAAPKQPQASQPALDPLRQLAAQQGLTLGQFVQLSALMAPPIKESRAGVAKRQLRGLLCKMTCGASTMDAGNIPPMDTRKLAARPKPTNKPPPTQRSKFLDLLLCRSHITASSHDAMKGPSSAAARSLVVVRA